MTKNLLALSVVAFILCLIPFQSVNATKLIEITVVDKQMLMLHFQDGYIEYNWDDTTTGSCNGWNYLYTENWHLCKNKDQYIPYGNPLDTDIIMEVSSFLVVSGEDDNYGSSGQHPVKIYRKSKVWEASHDERIPAMHHWIYVELQNPLQNGKAYGLQIKGETNTDKITQSFVYDEKTLQSPAIKISNVGYQANATHKFADVYLWMGDGGERDFSRFNDGTFYLYDVKTNKKAFSGTLSFRMGNVPEPRFEKDFTKADIWECDFSEFNKPGEYRLVIDGIGSSQPFTIGDNVFEEPFKVAMQGMFYQRMGNDKRPSGNFPKSRYPLFKQGVDPEDFVVYISEKDMVRGKNPDDRNFYSEKLSGDIAKSTWGGWCDAYDNDQRPVNFICVYDILLSYYLNPSVFTDNQLYIPETNNKIPDIIDEALWEIDWWLRMRDSKGGYLSGLTNIRPPENVNFAGAACAWQGWNVAAGCAMVADCFRLAGLTDLQQQYTDSALVAYQWATDQKDHMLDTDVSGLRGRDLKMTAEAFLFNLTGDGQYEKLLKSERKTTGKDAKIRNSGEWEQQFAAVAYLLSPQKVKYPELQSSMKKVIVKQAKTDYVDYMNASPTKAARWSSSWEGMMQTSNEMSLVAIAHKLSDDLQEKARFEKGLYAEAEWTLGRNPLGLIQMTGFGEKSVTQTFAPGRRDGHPGLTPGWTPFMCRDGWKNSDDIHRCEWYTNRNYPKNKEDWPWGEHFWNSRYSVPNSESTPQQNFRQKIVLYGYLFGMNEEPLNRLE